MKTLFTILMLVCTTLARTTDRNQNMIRKTKLFQGDDPKCNKIVNNAYCSPNFGQNYLNGIAKCGDIATNDINTIISSCGRAKTGQYCWVFFLSGSLASCYGSSCSAACSTSLKQADCCLNTTDDSYSQYLHWCGLPSPSPCNNSGLRIPNTTYDPTCVSEHDYDITQFKVTCENVQPVIDALKKNSCTDSSQYLMDYCSSRNGHYCFMELNVTGLESVGIQSLQKARQNCPSVSNCSSQCKSSLTTIVDTIGCCIHTANVTLGFFGFAGTVLNSSLWDACGLQIPKRCGSAFINSYYQYIHINETF